MAYSLFRIEPPKGAATSPQDKAFMQASYWFYHFMTGQGRPVRIRYVELVVNPALQGRFDAKLARLTDQGRPCDPRWVFHGTKATNIDPITRDGFQVAGLIGNVGIANGKANGYGVYTATGPTMSMGYVMDCSALILAEALPGSSGAKWRDPSSPPVDRDSWTDGENVIVFFSGEQVLPRFVVHY